MTKTTIVAEPGTQTITVTREFDAPPAAIFRAHVDPDLLVQWLGPRRLTMAIDYFEPRDGGRWRYVHSEPGGDSYGFHGVFHGDPSERGVTQTFEFEGWPGVVSLETITFEDLGGRTRLVGRSVYPSVESRDAMVESGMETGLNDGYDRIDELIASGTLG